MSDLSPKNGRKRTRHERPSARKTTPDDAAGTHQRFHACLRSRLARRGRSQWSFCRRSDINEKKTQLIRACAPLLRASNNPTQASTSDMFRVGKMDRSVEECARCSAGQVVSSGYGGSDDWQRKTMMTQKPKPPRFSKPPVTNTQQQPQ